MEYPILPVIKAPHEYGVEIPLNLVDLVILPVDREVAKNRLAMEVLDNVGYPSSVFPTSKQLQKGYHYYEGGGRRINILFISTADNSEAAGYWRQHLSAGFIEAVSKGKNSIVWIPATGKGLSLEQNLSTIADVINDLYHRYALNVHFSISLPKEVEDTWIAQQVRENRSEVSNSHTQEVEGRFKGDICLFSPEWEDNSERLTRLLLRNAWHKRHSLAPFLKEVKIGDVIVYNKSARFYSVTERKEVGVPLEIQAVGVVIPVSDGAAMKVDWCITSKELIFAIKHIALQGRYARVVQRLSEKDKIYLWRQLGPALRSILERTVTQATRPTTTVSKIGHFHNDTDTTTDHLDISNDVTAFARIIAASSFQPPMAVALLGKWGSGKSFFMEQLRRKIGALSQMGVDGAYCSGIAQIHFNAWSYMDTNLWASIISRIFEQLNIYIQADDSTTAAKNEIKATLIKRLSITSQEVSFLEDKKKQIDQQVKGLQDKVKNIRMELTRKIQAVRKNTLRAVIANVDEQFSVRVRILAALNKNKTFCQSKEELRKIVPDEYWENPVEAYKQAKSSYAFLRVFFRKGRWLINIGYLAAVILLIVIVPKGLDWLEQQIAVTGFLIPPFMITFLSAASVMFVRIRSAYKELKPIIASFWQIKEGYEAAITLARDKAAQDEKALLLQIEKNKAELIMVNEQVVSAKAVQADLDFRINNALATETLYNFIDKRSKSEDYRKHLGIISVIRKDLEILNSLFYEHQGEVQTNGEAEIFRNHFKVKLQRIVLYIDDLDRCPEETVVQVLEAVNLLMAFPLFVVVAGVDSRWIRNALLRKHAIQFNGLHGGLGAGGAELDPSDYLEKIFQVPFHLKEPTDTDVKGMISKLAMGGAPLPEIKTKKVLTTPTATSVMAASAGDSIVSAEKLTSTKALTDAIIPEISSVATIKEQIETLTLTTTEVEILQRMSGIVGNNPRTIKRFVNIFRIIKAHEEFGYEHETSNVELMSILFMLALSLGPFRKLIPGFIHHLKGAGKEEPDLGSYFQHRKDPGLEELKSVFERRVRAENLNFPIREAFFKHYDFIKRFAFKDI